MEKEILEHLIKDKMMSYKEVAEFTGVPKPTVAWYVKKYGISPAKKYYPLSEETLRDLYINQKLSAQSIAERLQVWEKTVSFWLRRYRIPIRPPGTNQFSHIPKKEKIKRPKQTKRSKIEDVIALVEAKGCKFLDLVYTNTRGRLFYTCHCGFNHSMLLSNFKKGYACAECKRRAYKGAKNHNFNPSLTEEDRLGSGRYEDGYKTWRRSVFKKYGFSCDICGNAKRKALNAHHLNSYARHPELRIQIENGVCLCESCHVSFHKEHGFGNNTEQQYQEFRRRHGSQNIRP